MSPRRLAVPFLAFAALVAVTAADLELQAQNNEPVAAAIGDLEWRHIGPVNMGGRVTAVVGIPGDPKTFWVGAADGGVWKTTNGGTTFEGQWQDEDVYSVGALALAPSDHNVLWLGSGEGDPRNSVSYGRGVWRSTDGGDTWTHLGLDETERIKRIVVDPRDPDVALVCALGREWGANEERGVFKTSDAGETWRKVLYIDQDTGCSDLDLDLSNPRNVYAGMWFHRRKPWRFDGGGKETALYVSRDAGETWTKIESTPDEPMARIGISVAQSSPNIVYLITEYPTAGTLFKSYDYGETWEAINDDRNLNFRPFYYADVFVDPSNENTLYTLSGGLSKSSDGGRTFQRIGQGVHGDHQAIWIDPADGDRVISGSDGGWQVSWDEARTFHIWRNLSLAQYYHVFVDDRDPYYVCGGLQDNGTWCGPSRSGEPAGIPAGDWYTVGGGDGFYGVPIPGQPNLIYSNAQGGYFRITDTESGLVRSIEPYPAFVGSQGQSMAQAKYRFNWDAPIVISPHDPNTVYWGGNVLFRSRDLGHSWDIISPDLTTNDPEKQLDSGGEIYNDNTAAEFHTTILTVAESPVEAGVIWVGTDDGNLQLTRDNGENWVNLRDRVPGLPEETWVGNIEASATEMGTAFVAVDNHRLDDFTPHIYETRDYGESWTDLSAGLPQDDYVKVIRQHPRNPDFLVVGMERGIYGSWDRGETWVDIRGNLPRVSVRGVRFQEQYNDLVIGTHGRGAFILDDLSALESLATAMDTEVHLFDVRLTTAWAMWRRGSNIGQSTFMGENPEPGAYINYYSRTKPEKVSVTINNAAGETVKTFDHRGARAGINRAVWDLTWDGPEPIRGTATTGFFAQFARRGPPAIPGTYTATINVDGVEQSTEFVLRGDPKVETSQADYEARLATARDALELQNQVNAMINTLLDLDAQVDGLLASIDGKDLANEGAIRDKAGEAKDQMAALENELRRPPPRMGYRQWPRLSEQIGFVARGINSAQARPTEGQVEVVDDVAVAVEQRAGELTTLINTTIAELNQLMESGPQILTNWRARRIS